MSYNLLSGSVFFEGATPGTIEDIVDTHTTQTISGKKTITTLTSSLTHISSRLQVGGTHATDHAVNINGALSGSGNISGSAFYANGVLLSTGGAVTALNNRAESRLVTIGATTTELDGEANLTFNGSTNVLAVTGSMTASTTIQATTSVSSAAIVGSTSVTSPSVTANAQITNDGVNLQTGIEVVKTAVVSPLCVPEPTGTKSMVYVEDISGHASLGGAFVNNQVNLPPPASGKILTITSIFSNPITILPVGGGVINLGAHPTHPYCTSANVITLAPWQSVTLIGHVDGAAPLVLGWNIISTA